MKIYRKKRFVWGLLFFLVFSVCLVMVWLRGEAPAFTLGMLATPALSGLLSILQSFSPAEPEESQDERERLIQLKTDALTFSILQSVCGFAGIVLILPYVFRETWSQAGLVGIVLMLVAIGTGVLQMGARLYYERQM